MNSDKFFPLNQLKEILDEHKTRKQTIALANGGFDLIHIGHVRYLKDAKKTANILVVALNSDHSLKRLKGEDRAVLDEVSRIRIISSFECVDYVTIFDEPTVDHVLLTLKPDFQCKGSDYTPETVPERKTVQSYGGKVVIVGGDKIRSTSTILKSIQVKN